MKKVLSISIIAAMLLAISGCSNITEVNSNTGSNENSAENSSTAESSENTASSGSENAESSDNEGNSGNSDNSESGADNSSDNSSASTDDITDGNKTQTADEMFTERDLSAEYSDCCDITLSGSGASCNLASVAVNDSVVTITEKGTYRLTGTFTGQIVVDCPDSDKVQLVLDNAAINNSGSAAIYVKQADKVFVTTAPGSSNKISVTGEFNTADNNIDGAIFSKADIVFNGGGTLDISCETAHGIVGKDDVKITGGSYTITAAKKGIDGKDSVRIAGGDITVNSGTDAIHSENADNSEKGYVYITGGKLNLTSGNDAIDASGYVTIKGGEFAIISGNGAESYIGNSSDSSDSFKGIKSDTALTISGGAFNIDSRDDAVHTNGSTAISGGEFEIKTGDDGIHSDATTEISGGSISITKSYEGIEGANIIISGGNISIVSSDDGINAAGGNDSSGFGNIGGFGGFGGDSFKKGGMGGGMQDGNADYTIEITGGEIVIEAEGDGIDSNGIITVSGGKTFVYGPVNGGNGSLDYGVSAAITGGIFAAAGSSGMAENFGSDSTQCAIMYNVQGSAGSEITLADSSGSSLISFTPTKNYQTVIISTPEIKTGETYKLTAGGQSVDIEMTSTIYGSGSGFGGDRGNGGRGERPGNTDGNFQPGGNMDGNFQPGGNNQFGGNFQFGGNTDGNTDGNTAV